MPTPSEEFVADPIDFMKNCIVLVGYSVNEFNELNNGGLVPMSLVELDANNDFHRAFTAKNQPMRVCRLVDGRRRPDSFPAFWCPYDNDRFGWTTIGRYGSYLFTATMDGCSFGVGNVTSDGAVTVGHANSQHLDSPKSKKAMESDQRRLLKVNLGKKVKILEPKHYRTLQGKRIASSTTFGLRNGNKWSFYSQQYRKQENGFYVDFHFIRLKKFFG